MAIPSESLRTDQENLKASQLADAPTLHSRKKHGQGRGRDGRSKRNVNCSQNMLDPLEQATKIDIEIQGSTHVPATPSGAHTSQGLELGGMLSGC